MADEGIIYRFARLFDEGGGGAVYLYRIRSSWCEGAGVL